MLQALSKQQHDAWVASIQEAIGEALEKPDLPPSVTSPRGAGARPESPSEMAAYV